MDDELVLEADPVRAPAEPRPWHVMVVDDEPDVHQITRLVFRHIQFDGRPVQVVSAHSAAAAQEMLQEHDDIALIILDVVMETDTAGLDLVRYIRHHLMNSAVRIVLRTGQPGQAPEEQVIRDFDINDYKSKTELTSTKLKTLLFSALRSYRDIRTLERSRHGLESVLNATGEVFRAQSLGQFASAVLEQVSNLIGMDCGALYVNATSAFASSRLPEGYHLLAATGEAFAAIPTNQLIRLPADIEFLFARALEQKRSLAEGPFYVGYFSTTQGSENLLYVANRKDLSELDFFLLDIFCAKVALAFDNLLLQDEIKDTQKELVYILSEAVEIRSRETGAHVKRVALLSEMLAKACGLSDAEAEMIKMASPLHDVGKIAIPDHILNKPGKHTPDEWDIMRTHAELGAEMLGQSEKRVLQLGAIIAEQHHERWNGAGYPRGLRGEDIHIAGRIVALVDVIDALGSARCYKQPWPMTKIVEHIRSESGQHFDPRLVELILQRMDFVEDLRRRLPDPHADR